MTSESALGPWSQGKTSPLCELADVRFRYAGTSADLLRAVSFCVYPGQVVLVTGPNGSGKSSLLGLISGRLTPTAGTVAVLGRRPDKASRLPVLGLITEPFHPEQSPLPVELSIANIIVWLRVLDRASGDTIDQCVDLLGIPRSLLGRPVCELSKGERQRALSSCALVRRPKLILADEPMEGLDALTRKMMGKALDDYVRSNSAAVIWVSHHVSETAEYADRLFEVDNFHVQERSRDRFIVRVISGRGQSRTEGLWGLDALPDLVAEELRREDGGKIHLELAENKP